eukprot:jgi/Picre1/33419/NNA_008743.t1
MGLCFPVYIGYRGGIGLRISDHFRLQEEKSKFQLQDPSLSVLNQIHRVRTPENGFLSRIEDIGLHHAKNICLNMDEDGIWLPSKMNGSEYTYLQNRPLSAKTMNASVVQMVGLFKGLSYISNCWRRPLKDTNPAHWAMKLGTLYTILHENITTNAPILSRLKRVVFHQCANPFSSGWEWGKFLWNKTIENAVAHRHFQRNEVPSVLWASELHKFKDVIQSNFICFEEVIWDTAYGLWIPKRAVQQWTRDMKNITPEEPRKNTIGVFERKTGTALRRFDNIGDIIRVAGRYTKEPIKIFSVDESTSPDDQVKQFNSMDILITSHGSQLANLVFVAGNISVIEIVACPADLVFRSNAKILGKQYILSTGHPIGKKCNNNTITSYNSILRSYNHIKDIDCEGLSTKQCDIAVNLTKLETALMRLQKT